MQVTSGELEVTIQATQGQVEGTGRGEGEAQDMSSMQENLSPFQSAVYRWRHWDDHGF